MQIFFFLKPFQQQFSVTGVDIPVEMAKVIARCVFTVVGEFNSATHLFCSSLGEDRSSKDPS